MEELRGFAAYHIPLMLLVLACSWLGEGQAPLDDVDAELSAASGGKVRIGGCSGAFA
ncbi:hypothetical protein [Nonomuraea sp. B1E8]|uniref:hypothetical protein n=1 Tax=unclassified Nonomuraea TaxID=2593643 RepID=UPI00325E9D1C